ncbi:MAG: hypothetical protein PHN61_06170 [Methanothrix sp.]|nr:hypothetical protein [Methanothrix sp.]
MNMDMQVLVGKEIKVAGRTIWPVTRIAVLRGCGDKVLSIQIKPLAMLILEPAGSFAVSFAGEPMTIEAILELAPPLRDVLKKAGEAGQD